MLHKLRQMLLWMLLLAREFLPLPLRKPPLVRRQMRKALQAQPTPPLRLLLILLRQSLTGQVEMPLQIALRLQKLLLPLLRQLRALQKQPQLPLLICQKLLRLQLHLMLLRQLLKLL